MELSKAYSIVPLSHEDAIPKIVEIFNSNGILKQSEHLKWQYIHNPGGGSYTSVAVSETDENASIYSMFRTKVKVDGELVTACQSLDTLTDAKHRGQGLFKKLANNVYDRARTDGVSLVYGFPNENSAPGFFGSLGWYFSGYPPFKIYIVNLCFALKYKFNINIKINNSLGDLFLKRRMDKIIKEYGFVCKEILRFDSDYDDLWVRFARGIQTIVTRDSEFMNWRYCQKPMNKYKIIGV